MSDGEYFVVKTDNLMYKTRVLKIEFPNEAIENAIAEPIASCRVPRQPLIESLDKLAIPLYGMKSEQQVVGLNIQNDSLIALVKDLGGRVSKATVSSASHEGEASSYVNINHLDTSAAVLSEDFEVIIHESVTVLEDENHQVILFNMEA